MTEETIDFDPPNLTDTVAVVTGSGSGIGAACATALADCGAVVFLVGRRPAPLRAVARRIGGEARVFPADIADPAAMEHLAHAIRADGYSSLHTLVNNAAILGPHTSLHGISTAEYAEVMRINSTGTFAVTKALLPLLAAASPEANVVNLTSSVGRHGRATWGPYSASKFAVESLTQTWAEELAADGIRVNALNPGGTRTAMRAEAMPSEDPASVPAPDEIVPSLLFFLSPQAREARITGRSLNSRDFM
ncbi:MAG: SDR family NAD(P)-dependent oxidoreductase [Deltaproteobacteria bacterium]|nr:SDR family NAD(P)-dependent oxidoreductase [Deltaproteobacteria bacterium]